MNMKNKLPPGAAHTKHNLMARAAALSAILLSATLLSGCIKLEKFGNLEWIGETESVILQEASKGSILSWNGEDVISAYGGAPWTDINEGVPYFSKGGKETEIFESYSDLDTLGRCGQAYANICKALMPMEERCQIGQVKPSGWPTVKYLEQISDLYLYNRCHLIRFQLAGENANEGNLYKRPSSCRPLFLLCKNIHTGALLTLI